MIHDPKALLEVRFVDDWDLGRDRVIGALYIPKTLRDARPIVDLFIQYNLVHPDLRPRELLGLTDPWKEERREKLTAAKHDFPRRFVYPVETIIPALTPEGKLAQTEDGNIPILYHSLYYRADDYKTVKRRTSFRPQEG